MARVVFRRLCPTTGRMLAVLLAVAAPLTNATAGVFGNDERRPIAGQDQKTANYVGLLKTDTTNSICTAVCLSNDIIATAGHCISPSQADASTDLKSVKFRPFSEKLRQHAPIAGAAIDNVNHSIISGNRSLRVTPPISAAHDWSLIKLDRPICRSGGLPLLASKPGSRDHMIQIAFHHDLGQDHLFRGAPCTALDPSEQKQLNRVEQDFVNAHQLLFHHCDAEVGSSGSPLLTQVANHPAIAAINVGTYYLASRAATAAARDEDDNPVNAEAVANTAIAAHILQMPLAELSARQPLSSKKEIARLSDALTALGYIAGPPVQTPTPRLRFAARQFADSVKHLEWQGLDQNLLDASEQAALQPN